MTRRVVVGDRGFALEEVRRLLARMPAGSVLVNTARAALVRALGSGRLAGAALDVLAGSRRRSSVPRRRGPA